ncbi:glutathione dehydrogenase [Aureococcus anophagefferens]|nr:glutathione dehydrogenase [Aureococcus anophagefferens]
MSAMTNTMATKDGSYKRNASKHRGTSVEPEAGRYRLHVALACPWAAGAVGALSQGPRGRHRRVRRHPTWQKTRDDADDAHCGWVYRSPGDAPLANPLGHGSFDCDDALARTVGASSIRDVYASCGDLDGPFTTPLLFDTKTNDIVSNESLDILRILNGHVYFKANAPAQDHPNLASATCAPSRDAVRRSTNMKHIKTHYFIAHLNPASSRVRRPGPRAPSGRVPVDLERQLVVLHLAEEPQQKNRLMMSKYSVMAPRTASTALSCRFLPPTTSCVSCTMKAEKSNAPTVEPASEFMGTLRSTPATVETVSTIKPASKADPTCVVVPRWAGRRRP